MSVNRIWIGCCKAILDAFEINEFDPEKRKKYEQDMCDEVSAI